VAKPSQPAAEDPAAEDPAAEDPAAEDPAADAGLGGSAGDREGGSDHGLGSEPEPQVDAWALARAADLVSFVVRPCEGLDLDTSDSDLGDLDDDSEDDGPILLAAERAGVEPGMELIEMDGVDLTRLAVAQVKRLDSLRRGFPRRLVFARPSRRHAREHALVEVHERLRAARLGMRKTHSGVVEVHCPADVPLGVLWRPSGSSRRTPSPGLTVRGFEMVYTTVTTGKRAGKKAQVAGPVRGQIATGVVEGMELATIDGIGCAGLSAADCLEMLEGLAGADKRLGFGWPAWRAGGGGAGEDGGAPPGAEEPEPLDLEAERAKEASEEEAAWRRFKAEMTEELAAIKADWTEEWRRRRSARRDAISLARQSKREREAREAREAALRAQQERNARRERERRLQREKEERIRAAKAAARAKRLAKRGRAEAERKASEVRRRRARERATELAARPDAQPEALRQRHSAALDAMQFLVRQRPEDTALLYGMAYMASGRALNRPAHPVAAEWAAGKGMSRAFAMERLSIEVDRLRRRQHFKKLDACCYGSKGFLLAQQLMAHEMKKSHKSLREIQGQRKALEKLRRRKEKRLKLLAEGKLGAAAQLKIGPGEEQVATYVRIYFNTKDSAKGSGLGYFHQFRGHDEAFNRRYGYAYLADRSERSQRTYDGIVRPGVYKDKAVSGAEGAPRLSERARAAAELRTERAVGALYGRLGNAVLRGEQTSFGIPGSPKRDREGEADVDGGSPSKKKKKKKKKNARWKKKKKRTAWEQGSSRAARTVPERLAVLFAEQRLDRLEEEREKAEEEAEERAEREREKEKQRKKDKARKKKKKKNR
jgi:hypothetical protein